MLEEEEGRLEGYIETQVQMRELEGRIRQYPKQSKRLLRQELRRIESKEVGTLNQKLDFFIKAIEETGEII